MLSTWRLYELYMNWRPNQSATPSLTSALVDSATKLSFRKVGEEVEKYTAGVISASKVHCLLTRVTQKEHYELKSAIAYEGWERHEDDSYSLLNKKAYCYGDDNIPFWQSTGIHLLRSCCKGWENGERFKQDFLMLHLLL